MKSILFFVMTLLLCTAITPIVKAQTTDTTITVKVKGIGCATDLKMVEANITKLEGIIECKVLKQGATTTFDVQFNTQLASSKDIYAAIEGTGGCENPDDRPYKVKR